jgi:hypothetical protein
MLTITNNGDSLEVIPGKMNEFEICKPTSGKKSKEICCSTVLSVNLYFLLALLDKQIHLKESRRHEFFPECIVIVSSKCRGNYGIYNSCKQGILKSHVEDINVMSVIAGTNRTYYLYLANGTNSAVQ